MSDQGWVKLYRSILESPIFTSDKPYDDRSAWVYLFTIANHKNGSAFDKIAISKGQHVTSINRLANIWHWRKARVRDFLALLEREKMISQHRIDKALIITVTNYEKYQGSK